MNSMTSTSESTWTKARRQVGWWIRATRPSRPVRRTVQGVELLLPWSHRLPDYATAVPEYGQNLVRIARALGDLEGPVQMVDVGANVGDSAVQVLNATEALVLCVEADAYYMHFLEANVGADARVAIERSLLTPGASTEAMAPVRSGGTTRFEPGTSAATSPSVTPEELRRRHPSWDRVRLIKSDTDGHDVVLIPALARAWPDSRPVLFFEFDPRLTRAAGHDVATVWAELASLGYAHVAIWDNFGRALALAPIDTVVAWSAERSAMQGPKEYWDVAVVHSTDDLGAKAVANAIGTVPAAPPA